MFSDNVGLISTMPKSGTWYCLYFFNTYENLLYDNYSSDLEPNLNPHNVPFLRLNEFYICHATCPGFDYYNGQFRRAWDGLHYYVEGYNYGNKHMSDGYNPFVNKHAKIVYLYRNPLDQAVSFFRASQKHKDERQRYRIDAHGSKKLIKNVREFIMTVGLESYLKQFLSFWLLRKTLSEQLLLLTYEQLVIDPANTFLAMFRHFGYEPSPTLFEKSLKETSMDSMRKREDLMGRSLGNDQIDLNARHVHDGKIGKWQHHLSSSDLPIIESKLNQFKLSLENFEIYDESKDEGDGICVSIEPKPLKDEMINRIDSAENLESTGKASKQGEYYMNSPDVILKSIKQLLISDHKEAAYWAMDKLLEDFPDNAQLYFEMAAMAYEQNDLHKALLHYQKTIALAPDNPLYLKSLGDFYYVVTEDTENALAQYEKVLHIDPNHIDALIMAGHVCLSFHRYADAQRYYEQVQQLDPGNAEVGEFLSKIKNVGHQEKTSSINANDLYAAAQTKAQEGDRETAISLLEQLLARDDTHALAHNDLGVLQYENGNLQASLGHYEQATRLQPENEIFQKNLADFYWVALADPEKAMQQYVQALKLNPQDVESLLGCVQICMALNRTEDAREFLEVALSIEPWNDNVIQMRKQLENGTETVGPVNDSNDLYEQAKHKAASGDLEGAIHDLTHVLVHSPDESKYHNELGILYYETGEKEKALASYEQAVRLEPSEHNYAKNLADYYLVEQGRAEDAMKLYLQVLENNPEDIEALMATGLVCTSIGHAKDAKHFYDRVLELEPWNQEVQEAIENIQKHVNQEEKQVEHKTAAG